MEISMNRLLSSLPPIVLLAAAAGCAAAQAATSAGNRPVVNPLTGQPLAFETAQRKLEQMRLETQLLEEEAKQSAIRNNMSLAPIRRGHEERRLQAEMFGHVLPTQAPAPGPGATTGVGPPAPSRVRHPPRAGAPSPSAMPPAALSTVPGVSSMVPMVPAALPAQGPQVLAILRHGAQRRAIVQSGTTTSAVSEGDEWMGRRIETISDGSVTIDGAVIDLPRNPAVIVASDRRPPPGQPVRVQTQRAPQGVTAGTIGSMGQGVPPTGPARMPAAHLLGMGGDAATAATATLQPFPPLPPLPSLPVIGPLDPRNPLSVLGPQPSGLPLMSTPGSPMPLRIAPGAGMPGPDGLR
jgi:hypothetical protein